MIWSRVQVNLNPLVFHSSYSPVGVASIEGYPGTIRPEGHTTGNPGMRRRSLDFFFLDQDNGRDVTSPATFAVRKKSVYFQLKRISSRSLRMLNASYPFAFDLFFTIELPLAYLSVYLT